LEDRFRERLTFLEKLPKMPTEEDVEEWEDEDKVRNFKRMNEQLYKGLVSEPQGRGTTPLWRLREALKVLCTRVQSRDRQYATTMMIRNIPRRIGQSEFAQGVDASGFRDIWDFLYLPCNISEKEGKGYAFVNFVTPEAAQAFKTAWNAKTRFKMGMKKVLDVSASSIQGKAANLAQWQRGKTNRRITNPSCRPIVKELPKSLKLEDSLVNRDMASPRQGKRSAFAGVGLASLPLTVMFLFQ